VKCVRHLRLQECGEARLSLRLLVFRPRRCEVIAAAVSLQRPAGGGGEMSNMCATGARDLAAMEWMDDFTTTCPFRALPTVHRIGGAASQGRRIFHFRFSDSRELRSHWGRD